MSSRLVGFGTVDLRRYRIEMRDGSSRHIMARGMTETSKDHELMIYGENGVETIPDVAGIYDDDEKIALSMSLPDLDWLDDEEHRWQGRDEDYDW
jgi:hypothetical protein